MDFNNLVAQLNAGAILPEGIVIITLLTVLVGDLIFGRTAARNLSYIAIGGLVLAIAALTLQWDNTNSVAFIGAFSSDPLSVVFRGIVALAAAVTILMSISYVEQTGTALAEFVTILLTATLGGMLLSGATELVTIFVSLETLSISSYLMTGYMKRDPRSNEAALKYLLIGASSSAVFLYGVSLLYGLSGGETTLAAIAAGIANANGNLSLGLIVSLVFVIAGIAFKISAVPFHQWTPDVYEGSPTPVVAFLSVGSKAAGFALAIRLLVTAFPLVSAEWHFIFYSASRFEHGVGKYRGVGADEYEANASILIDRASWLCDDRDDYWYRNWLCQYGVLSICLPVYELGWICLCDSICPTDGYRSD